MAGRRRRRTYRDFIINDPCDGLEINRFNYARFISKRSSTMSMFDGDNIVIELDERQNGSRFHRVSVLCEVKRVNISKTGRINKYKDRIKGR